MKTIELIEIAGLLLAIYLAHKCTCETRKQTPFSVRALIAIAMLPPCLMLVQVVAKHTADVPDAIVAWGFACTYYLIYVLIGRIQRLRDEVDHLRKAKHESLPTT